MAEGNKYPLWDRNKDWRYNHELFKVPGLDYPNAYKKGDLVQCSGCGGAHVLFEKKNYFCIPCSQPFCQKCYKSSPLYPNRGYGFVCEKCYPLLVIYNIQ